MSFKKSWKAYLDWLKPRAPELVSTLLPGFDESTLLYLEEGFGFTFPPDVREYFQLCGGQAEEAPDGLLELFLLSKEGILDEWQRLGEMLSDFHRTPGAEIVHEAFHGPVRHLAGNRGWIPFATDHGGHLLMFDLDPDHGGSIGQVLSADYNEQEMRVVAASLSEFVSSHLERLKSGEITLEVAEVLRTHLEVSLPIDSPVEGSPGLVPYTIDPEEVEIPVLSVPLEAGYCFKIEGDWDIEEASLLDRKGQLIPYDTFSYQTDDGLVVWIAPAPVGPTSTSAAKRLCLDLLQRVVLKP